MASITEMRAEAAQIDEEKIVFEARFAPKFKSIFRNMADDAYALYRSTGGLDPEELAKNYSTDFTKEIRDLYRKTIKHFGFKTRNDIESKSDIFFDAEYKKQFIDIEHKASMVITDDNLDEKVERINNEFFLAATLFIANQSENQTSFISQTNAKEIRESAARAEVNFADDIARDQENINTLQNEAAVASEAERRRLNRRLSANQTRIDRKLNNSQEIIANNLRTNLMDRSPARSGLIAAQNVGLAESWASQTEAELIANANLQTTEGRLVDVQKTWVAILDSKTRASHATADLQQVGVNDNFTVGGESLMMPRDPSGSAGNIINCRCISRNNVDFI